MGSKPGSTPGDLASHAAAEVRAELGRRGLAVSALDGVIGSHSYVFARLSRRATMALTLNDVEGIEDFFSWPRLELMRRAYIATSSSASSGVGPGFDAAEQGALDQIAADVQRKVSDPTHSDTRSGDSN